MVSGLFALVGALLALGWILFKIFLLLFIPCFIVYWVYAEWPADDNILVLLFHWILRLVLIVPVAMIVVAVIGSFIRDAYDAIKG